MEPYVINKNSWHYKLLLRANHEWDLQDSCQDICSYYRKLAFTILVLSVVSFMLLFLASTFFYINYKLITDFIYGLEWSIAAKNAIIVWQIFSVVLVGACLVFVVMKVNKFLSTRKPSGKIKVEGFIKTAYRAWKGKYCTPIEFKE